MKVYGGIYDRTNRRVDTSLTGSVQSIFSVEAMSFSHRNFGLGEFFLHPVDDRFSLENGCNVAIVGDICIYNRDNLCNTLSLNGEDCTDFEIVIKAYEKWHEQCAKYIFGDYSFVVWDNERQQIFAARDQVGIIPLYYFLDSDTFLFSNKLHFLAGYSFSDDLSDEWIIAFLEARRASMSSTAFSNVKCLPPGCTMLVDSRRVTIKKFWFLDHSRNMEVVDRHIAVAEVQKYLFNAVSQRMRSHHNIALELSGGMDSSAVAGAVGRFSDSVTSYAFTNVKRFKNGEEMNEVSIDWTKAAEVTRHVGIHAHYPIDKAARETLSLCEWAIDIIGQPTCDYVSLGQTGIFEAAEKCGVTAVFSGYGGDDVISAYTRNAYVFSSLRKFNVNKAYKLFISLSDKRWRAFLNTAKSLLNVLLQRQRRIRKKITDVKWRRVIVRDEWLTTTNRKFFYKRLHFDPYLSIAEKATLSLENPVFVERLETGYHLAAAHGLEYKHPLLDVDLISFYQALPDIWKVDYKHGRGIIRAALKGVIPDNVISQKKEGAAIPFYQDKRDEIFDEVKNWCLNLPANHRLWRYVDRDKLAATVYDGMNIRATTYSFYYLRCAAQLAMFFDKRANMKLYDI